MRVFISWSGDRSRQVAKHLRDWPPMVLHYVEPWVSDADIEAGERWAQTVAGELEISNFGIVCVTPENLNSPWLLFESDALAKSLDAGRVIPLLLDLDFSEISGPLAQFQAKKLTQQGMQEIISSIQANSDSSIPEGRADGLFKALWAEFEQPIGSIEKPEAIRHTRPQPEVLEELVASVRSVESRVREFGEESTSYRRPVRSHREFRMSYSIAQAAEPPWGICR